MGGTVEAVAYQNTSYESGAGIGAGYFSSATMNINIAGGRVYAYGGSGAAGIGGARNSTTPSVKIGNGTVTAKGDPDVNSVNDIGAGQGGTGTAKAVVTGGSVSLVNGKGTLYPSASSTTPLSCVTVGNLGGNQSATVSFSGLGYSYGNIDVVSDEYGKIYLWAPPANYSDKLYVNGTRYDVNATSGDAVANVWTPPPPANDNFANATAISGKSGKLTGTTLGATKQDRSVVGGDAWDQEGSVWYTWKAPASGRVRFIVEHTKPSSGNNMYVYAWKGTSGTALAYPANPVQSSLYEDNHGIFGQSVTFDAVKDETYKITVAYSSYPDTSGAFSLLWDEGSWGFYLGKDGKAKIRKDTDLSGAVTLPSTLFGCTVTEIMKRGFANAASMTSVTIPSSVKVIGKEAFDQCTALTTATLQSGVAVIGEDAFSGCSSLAQVTIPESVVSIGASAFNSCAFASVTLQSGLKSIGEWAFAYNKNLASITIPAGVTSIGENAFKNCSNLEWVQYLGGCPEVDDSSSSYYIYNNTPNDLVSVVPDGDSSWDDAVAAVIWQGRTVKRASAPANVTVTFDLNGGTSMNGASSFTAAYGTMIGSLPTPTRISGIYWTFQGWWTTKSGSSGTQLTASTRMTANATYYARWKRRYYPQFYNNILFHYYLEPGPTDTAVIEYADEDGKCAAIDTGTTGAITVPETIDGYKVVALSQQAFRNCTKITAVNLPSTITNIGLSAFYWCQGLTEITIPAGVRSLGDYAFLGCSNLKTVKYLGSLPALSASVGTYPIYSSTPDDLVSKVPSGNATWSAALTAGTWQNRAISTFEPPTVKVTFSANGGTPTSQYKNVAVGTVLGDIDLFTATPTPPSTDKAFNGWWTQSSGGEQVTASTIVSAAVTYYAHWKAAPTSVKTEVVNGYTWYYKIGTDGTAEIYRGTQMPAVDPKPGAGALNIPAKLGGVDVTVIGGDAFYGCSGMTSVNFPDTIKTIWSGAFMGCSGMTGILKLPSGLTTIRSSAFADCSGITGVRIPATLQSIEGYAFLRCSSLTKVMYHCNYPASVGSSIYQDTPADLVSGVDTAATGWDAYVEAGVWQGRAIRKIGPVIEMLEAGVYWKATLDELGFDVPTDGTAYSVKALGLPAGLKLKYNAAKKDKKGKVVTKAKSEWWIEGVPTASMDYNTNPAYLVITAFGKTETVELELGVEAFDVEDLGELALGDSLNAEGWLTGVDGTGWTVTGLPTGLKYTAKVIYKDPKAKKKVVKYQANTVYGKVSKAGLYTITAKKKKSGFYEMKKYKVLVRPKAVVDDAYFGTLPDRTTTANDEPVNWNLMNDVSAVGGVKVAKVTGLPKGLTFAAANTYKDKKKKVLKQTGQTIVGTPTKPGTYLVTFTKNVKVKKKTVAKTAQFLWTIVPNTPYTPTMNFNTSGGEVEEISIGLKYTGALMTFSATDTAKVTASGLPKGITLVSLGGGSWGFQGYATKAGTYLVTVTATEKGMTTRQRVALKVNGLPAWAKGTFPSYTKNHLGRAIGLGTMSVTSAGKVSGKFTDEGQTWTFSAPCFTETDGTYFSVPVTAKRAYKVKNGKKTVTKYETKNFTFTVQDGEFGGVAEASSWDLTTVCGRQNLWGSTYKKVGAKVFVTGKKKFHVYEKLETVNGKECILSLKVTTAGKVTATLKYDTGKKKNGKKVYYKPSCSTVVWPITVANPTGFEGFVYVYFAPSAANNFPGFDTGLNPERVGDGY